MLRKFFHTSDLNSRKITLIMNVLINRLMINIDEMLRLGELNILDIALKSTTTWRLKRLLLVISLSRRYSETISRILRSLVSRQNSRGGSFEAILSLVRSKVSASFSLRSSYLRHGFGKELLLTVGGRLLT